MAIKFLSSENIAGDIDVTLSKNGITYLAVTNTDTGVSANARVQVVGESSQLDLVATSAGYTGVTGWADSGIISTDSGASGGLKLNSQSGGIQLQAGTTSYVIMDASGFLGVNMTPDTGVRLSVSGAIGPTNGTEGAPTYTFYSDPNTGMFRSGADTLGFSTGGTTRLSVRAAGINVVGETETDTLLCSGISTLASSVAIGGSFSPDRTLDVRGTGMSIYGTGNYTELMLRGQVEGTGTVRNVGAFHLSIRSDVGGDNDDLKLLRFVTGSYAGIAMQVQNSTGDIFFGNTIVNPASGFSDQKGLGYDNSTGNLEAASTSGTAMTIGRNEASDGQILQLRKESNIKHSFGSTTSYLLSDVGIGTSSPDGKLEVAGGTTLGFRLSNAGDSSAYDQVRFTYGGYNSGAPTVTFMPLTTPGSGNVDTTFHFMNTNGLNSNNNRANVNIDGILYVGSGRQSGETTLIMRNYDDSLVDTGSIQNSIRMSGRYWSGSASQLVETRINSVHQESNGNGGSALTFWTQTGGDAPNEKLRIDKSGRVIVYQKENVSGFYLDGGNTRLYANGGGGTDYRGIECNSSGMWSWGETGTHNYFAKPIGIGVTSTTYPLEVASVEVAARFTGSQTGHTQGAILLSSGTADTPQARGQGVFRFNEGNDETWYTGTAYANTNRYIWARKSSTTSFDSGAAQLTYAMMSLTNDGKLGIGTTSPSTPLMVNRASNSNEPGIYYDVTGGGSGSVGIGSTAAFGPFIVGNTLPNGNVRGAYSASRMLFNGGGFSFQTSDETSGARTFDDRMKIEIGGNVGIGTTSPTSTLSVQGTTNNGINVIGVGTTANRCYVGLNSSNHGQLFCTGSSGQSPSLISSAGAYSYISGGRFGILTTSPSAPLDVAAGGSANQIGAAIFHENSTTAYLTTSFNSRPTHTLYGINTTNTYVGTRLSNAGNTEFFHGIVKGAANGEIKYVFQGYNGTAYQEFGYIDCYTTGAGSLVMSGDIVAYSDKKLKKNIKTLDGSKVYKMRGVSFDRIDTGKKSSGVIAQEIQKVAPELVNESKEGTLGVAYGNLTGYLIEAIKELKAEVEELKKQIN